MRMFASILFTAAYAVLAACSSNNGEIPSTPPTPEEKADTVANVKGQITCEGQGVPGVSVSDGYEVVTTDAQGRYAFHSAKKNKYVFVSVPGDYTMKEADGNLPTFFKYLTEGEATPEEKNFELTRTDNSRYHMLCFTDTHLAARNDDREVFDAQFVPDINAKIESLKKDGANVYAICLGDLTWDLYWYQNSFALPQYKEYVKEVECPVYHVMGNHDNDPYAAPAADGTDTDWNAATPFKEDIAPNYYSFNIGRTHYVVLDNIVYLNDGGAPGVVGKRNYDARITPSQMEWLRKDLATVKDKEAPLVIAMHIPYYSNPGVKNGQQSTHYALDNPDELTRALKGFSDVHIWSGHTHISYNIEGEDVGIYEHNTPAVCATWWWTSKKGYAGNMICKDGSPAGYAVYDFNGKNVTWKYKSLGYEDAYQFRTYDLNQCHITAGSYAPNVSDEDILKYAGAYAQPANSNEILINVWNYDPSWKIEVTEADGKSLPVTRVQGKDPLHIISYELLRLNKGAQPTGDFVTGETAHLFKAKASDATGTLTIRTTDRFGNVYTQKMERPKALKWDMK